MFSSDDIAANGERFLTAGLDIGMRSVKMALLSHGAGAARVVASEAVAVLGRRDTRDAEVAVRESWNRVLRAAGVAPPDIVLVASTGAKERAVARVGHFYRRLSLATGARFLFPGATAVLDVGARQMRCTLLYGSGAGRSFAATGTGASFGSEILEGIARRSGGASGAAALSPEAVIAYDDLAARAVKLLGPRSLGGPTVVTGALGLDLAFVRAVARRLAEEGLFTTLVVSPDAIFAAAYGAALLAARRYLSVRGSAARRGAVPPRHSPQASRLILN